MVPFIKFDYLGRLAGLFAAWLEDHTCVPEFSPPRGSGHGCQGTSGLQGPEL